MTRTAFAARLMTQFAFAAVAANCVSAAGRAPNVLHLMADDMRPELSCYGQTRMVTPNLAKLASSALTFDHAYTQFAYCACGGQQVALYSLQQQ